MPDERLHPAMERFQHAIMTNSFVADIEAAGLAAQRELMAAGVRLYAASRVAVEDAKHAVAFADRLARGEEPADG